MERVRGGIILWLAAAAAVAQDAPSQPGAEPTGHHGSTVVVRSGVKIQEFRRTPSQSPRPTADTTLPVLVTHTAEPTETETMPAHADAAGWRRRFAWSDRHADQGEPPLPEVALPSFQPQPSHTEPPPRTLSWAQLPSFPLRDQNSTAAGNLTEAPNLTEAGRLPGWNAGHGLERNSAADVIEAKVEPLRSSNYTKDHPADGRRIRQPINAKRLPSLSHDGSKDGPEEASDPSLSTEATAGPAGQKARVALGAPADDAWRVAWHQNENSLAELDPPEDPYDAFLRPMHSLDVNIAPSGAAPSATPLSAGAGLHEPHMECGTLLWEAPGSMHQPLYFEDVNLERAGHSWGVFQPAMSAVHFFGRMPALPYLLATHPARECVYTLGHFRPGSCAPQQFRTPRTWSWKR